MEKNKNKMQLKGKEILGKKVLILGEAGSGKTKLAAQLLRELMMLVNPEEITVIDLAPQRVGEIGGKLTDYVSITGGVKYFSPKNVYTPRLSGTSPKQVLHYAELNRKNMESLLNRFNRNITEVLVLNDVTLYLHSGKLETVLECVRLANTFLATAYYGSKLAEDLGTGISSREKQLTDKLATSMDLTLKIN
ncbi:MAG: ATP-binding protein [Candidatus Bathyarchaeota archaeon]|nr:ATP-binding protein [Candidatus Bathyarchaeota archaeon]